jgi:hypothetical protein
MQLKPWMLNDKMWASGTKANKWPAPKAWQQFGWFTSRKGGDWSEAATRYFDFTFAIMMQKDTGWN